MTEIDYIQNNPNLIAFDVMVKPVRENVPSKSSDNDHYSEPIFTKTQQFNIVECTPDH